MDYTLIQFKPNDTHHIRIGMNVYKIHVCHVVDSIYQGRKLVVFRWYGKHKQWWHEDMKDDDRLSWEIQKLINEEK